ncbi:uncharacterized protein [Parasteatoda tepidariorum]|uniref:uncharacterized protein n=1 Tax=Parasteatoda tepidariorum TaxID=114398 RepID=UPI00077F824B
MASWLVANGDAAGTLKFVYQPIFSYCNEVLISTAASTIQKLDIEQNQALRTITGTIRFTPILAMQCLTGNPPVRSIIERDAILLYERLIRLPNNTFCRDYDTNAKRNLKTQGDFLQYAFPAANDINVHLNPKRLYRPVCPLSYGGISVCLSLDRQVNKCHMRDQQLRAIALSTIENKFPGHTWLHVYTDGSMFSDEDGAGAGVYCDLLSCYSPIGAHSPHYDGEIEAIYIALKQLANHSSSFCTVVTLSDFTSALESFADRQYNTRILECRELVMLISVSFQWILAHRGIPGNEVADFLTKQGAGILQRPLKSHSFHAVKLLIKRRCNTRIRQKALCNSEGPYCLRINS